MNVDENEIWSELQESHTSDFTVSQACCIECLTKTPVFLPSCMSPQRRRRLSKFGNRIRKSFRAAKRWKSSLRLGRRSSTFRVRKLIGQYFDWSYALTMNCFVCLRPVLTLSPHSSVSMALSIAIWIDGFRVRLDSLIQKSQPVRNVVVGLKSRHPWEVHCCHEFLNFRSGSVDLGFFFPQRISLVLF